jgi:hypothetical protein
MSCGISPAFAGLSPIRGQIAHVLLTRAPCAHLLYCYRKLRTRLACVKHAASVRSEPGSNSHVKLAAQKIKKPDLDLSMSDPIFQANFLSLDSLNPSAFPRRSQSNGFWHISSGCQRAGLLSSRQATKQSESIAAVPRMSSSSSTTVYPSCLLGPTATLTPYLFDGSKSGKDTALQLSRVHQGPNPGRGGFVGHVTGSGRGGSRAS